MKQAQKRKTEAKTCNSYVFEFDAANPDLLLLRNSVEKARQAILAAQNLTLDYVVSGCDDFDKRRVTIRVPTDVLPAFAKVMLMKDLAGHGVLEIRDPEFSGIFERWDKTGKPSWIASFIGLTCKDFTKKQPSPRSRRTRTKGAADEKEN